MRHRPVHDGALTVGQAARLLGLHPREVAKLLDGGALRGWRLGFGRRERRVSRAQVEKFARKNGIPLAGGEEKGGPDA